MSPNDEAGAFKIPQLCGKAVTHLGINKMKFHIRMPKIYCSIYAVKDIRLSPFMQ